MSLIGKMAVQSADAKLWRENIQQTIPEGGVEELRDWVVSQFADNLAPLLEASARAVSHELGELHEAHNELTDVVNEIIEHEESFLREDVATQFANTFMLGSEICAFVTAHLGAFDELTAKKLTTMMTNYKQQATIALDEIEQIVEGDEEDAGEATELHGQGGDPEGANAGGEDQPGAGGSARERDGETPDDGGH